MKFGKKLAVIALAVTLAASMMTGCGSSGINGKKTVTTVNGETLTTSMANVDSDPAYEPDTEAIADGYFHESEYRSAPYFNVAIDGIELLNSKF